MKMIQIIITPQGQATIQTEGFTGSSCREASSFLEQALGEKTAEQLTAEFYQAATVPQQVEER